MEFGYIILSGLSLILNIITWVVLLRCLLSYVMQDENFLTNLVYMITEPFLRPIRMMLNKTPLNRGGVDFSPVVFVILVSVLDGFLNF